MFTAKQDRNGADVGVPTHNSAQPGPDATAAISGLKSKAEAAGNAFAAATKGAIIVSPFGAGTSGSTFGDGGSWEWDSGLAVAEQPGEA